MTSIIRFIHHVKLILCIVIVGCFSVITLALANETKQENADVVLSEVTKIPSVTPTLTISTGIPSLQVTPAISGPSQAIFPTAIPRVIRISTSNQPTVVPSDTPAPSPIAETFKLLLTTKNETESFTIAWKADTNACDALNLAKELGYLQSLTIDESYTKTLGSPYVYEINGLKNSWVFTVNGETITKGCAFITVNKNDVVEWKYL